MVLGSITVKEEEELGKTLASLCVKERAREEEEEGGGAWGAAEQLELSRMLFGGSFQL